MKQERRFLNQEILVEGSTESPKIAGYASVFNKKSHDLGNFREVVDPKAFDSCLAKNPQVLGLFNHSNDMVLGSTSSGTLKLSVDEVGLKYEIDPPNTSYANDLLVSMRRKDIKDASFGFYAIEDKWHVDPKTHENIRTILQADVFDVSVVSSGAYPDASSQVRSLFPEDKGLLPEAITTKIAELRTNQRKERNLRSVLSAVAGYKWAILPEKLDLICGILNQRASGISATKEEIQAAMMGQEQVAFGDSQGGVAVLPIYGTIAPKATMMSEFSGGFSCENFTKDFRAALADDSVTAIVFDVDSPGGTVTGVPELAAEIRAARGKKPIVAVANGMAASAAYWLASAADKFYVTPSGEVGSIGVYTTHQDVSGAMEQAGVKITFIQAAKFKTEGNPYEAPSAGFIAETQKDVDAYYEMFTSDVAAGRNVSVETVKADYGQGRMLMANNALAAGMVDGIQTLDEVVAGLGAVVTSDVSTFTAPNSDLQALNQNGCSCLCNFCVNGDCAQCADPDCKDGDCKHLNDDSGLDTDDGLDTGNGAEVKPKPVKAEGDAACGCICDSCATGDCADCDDAQCVDPYCIAYHPVVDNKDEEASAVKPSRAAYLAKVMSMFTN